MAHRAPPSPELTNHSTDSTATTFQRFRGVLEHSLRTATRSRKHAPPPPDDFGTVRKDPKDKEKDKEKDKLGVFRRVTTFRKNTEREQAVPIQPFISPSLRLASLSTPVLSQKPPQQAPAVPISPSRSRISAPVPLAPKTAPTRHRSTKSATPALPSGSSTPHPPPDASPLPRRDLNTPPASPNAPIAPIHRTRTTSADPRARVRIVTPPAPTGTSTASNGTRSALTSASTSHLPPRRPSIDSPRRTSDSTRRTSFDVPPSPSRPSFSSSRTNSPSPSSPPSSPVRPRAITPIQKSYAQNRHFNISSGSLILPPSNPEHRDLIRRAISILCKEMAGSRPPPHLAKTEVGRKDWEEVESRMQLLVRLERVWQKMPGPREGASSPVPLGGLSPSTSASTGLSVSGEERERRLFAEALRDGFVLCQLLNKLRESHIVRPDPREDGATRTSNITRFLAACASYGLSNGDLFQRDDLIEASGESLARVAKCIIVLVRFRAEDDEGGLSTAEDEATLEGLGTIRTATSPGSKFRDAQMSTRRGSLPTATSPPTISNGRRATSPSQPTAASRSRSRSKRTSSGQSATATTGQASSAIPTSSAGSISASATGPPAAATVPIPYSQGSLGRAAASTPNLHSLHHHHQHHPPYQRDISPSHPPSAFSMFAPSPSPSPLPGPSSSSSASQPSIHPPPPPLSPTRKRWNPPSELEPVVQSSNTASEESLPQRREEERKNEREKQRTRDKEREREKGQPQKGTGSQAPATRGRRRADIKDERETRGTMVDNSGTTRSTHLGSSSASTSTSRTTKPKHNPPTAAPPVPPAPPPRSPLRKKSSRQLAVSVMENSGLFTWAKRNVVVAFGGAGSGGGREQRDLHQSRETDTDRDTDENEDQSDLDNADTNQYRASVADSTRASVGDASVMFMGLRDSVSVSVVPAESGDSEETDTDFDEGDARRARRSGSSGVVRIVDMVPPSSPSHHQHNPTTNANARQSFASTVLSDTSTTMTAVSSLLDPGRRSSHAGGYHHYGGGNRNVYEFGNGGGQQYQFVSGGGGSSGQGQFGTIRSVGTMNTDLTSEGRASYLGIDDQPSPGLGLKKRSSDVGSFASGSGINGAAATAGKYRLSGGAESHSGGVHSHMVDLSRVAEEMTDQDSGSSKGKRQQRKRQPLPTTTSSSPSPSSSPLVSSVGLPSPSPASSPALAPSPLPPPSPSPSPGPHVHLRKGKWPDDFIDAFRTREGSSPGATPTRSALARELFGSDDDDDTNGDEDEEAGGSDDHSSNGLASSGATVNGVAFAAQAGSRRASGNGTSDLSRSQTQTRSRTTPPRRVTPILPLSSPAPSPLPIPRSSPPPGSAVRSKSMSTPPPSSSPGPGLAPPLSISPRKIAIVGNGHHPHGRISPARRSSSNGNIVLPTATASSSNNSISTPAPGEFPSSPLSPGPRRPTHRPRRSVDGISMPIGGGSGSSPNTSVLLPKEVMLRRDASPDSVSNARVVIRRHASGKHVVNGSGGSGSGGSGGNGSAERRFSGSGERRFSGSGIRPGVATFVHRPSLDSPRSSFGSTTPSVVIAPPAGDLGSVGSAGGEALVPFPRQVSIGDVSSTSAGKGRSSSSSRSSGTALDPHHPSAHHQPPHSPLAQSHPHLHSPLPHNERQPRQMLRGRFQSEEGSSRKKGRPSSYDDLGGKPTGSRTRIESMVNLGVSVTSGVPSASDLSLSRDSMDGSAVKTRLVVREEGKPPTHLRVFVAFSGGAGVFGALGFARRGWGGWL